MMFNKMCHKVSKLNIAIILISSIFTITIVNGELFTALAEMEEVLETEAVLISNLENYISAQEQKLIFLRRKISEYHREHNEAAVDVTSYLSNPVNAYLLTKRLTVDWRQVEDVMTYDVGGSFVSNITKYREVLKFPTDEDLNGAAVALTRLQDTYKLDTHKVAQGELNGVQYR